MKLTIINTILFLFATLNISAQPKCYFEHYGPENGLPQHSVMDMLQDKKGFMWFSTWNGLCKFDGYNFHTYRIDLGDSYYMRSNRIDHIYEDKYGYIWTLPYDGEPHRFDPRTETFMSIRTITGHKDSSFLATELITMPSGKTWMISENKGCVCVHDSTFRISAYNTVNGKINGNNIYSVFEDSELNSWILSDNGLYLLSYEKEDFHAFHTELRKNDEKLPQPFFAVVESGNELWFGSENGKIHIYDKQNKTFQLLELQVPVNVRDIKKITDNLFLFVLEASGFIVYDRNTKEETLYNTSNLADMCSNTIESSYVDRNKNVWFDLDCIGTARFDITTRKIYHYRPNIEKGSLDVVEPNFFIVEDNEDRLWVHSRGGGFGIYSASENRIIPFYNDIGSHDWKFSNIMHIAYSDHQGNLWLSTHSHGIEKITFCKDVFQSTVVDEDIHSTMKNDVRAIFEDDKQNLWVSTKKGRVYVYDKSRNKIGHITSQGNIGYGDDLEGVTYCFMQDDEHNIWLGTKGNGIYKLTSTGTNKFHITQYRNSPTDSYSLSDDRVYTIFQDKRKRIWVGTYGGGLNLLDSENDGRFFNHKNEMKNYSMTYGSQVRIVADDKYGNICVGTTLGLFVLSLDFDSVRDMKLKYYERSPKDGNTLTANDIFDICTTKKGETYIATFGGGINKIEETDSLGFPQSFKTYRTTDGLASNVVLTITEDAQGKLWITSEGYLTKYDPEENNFITYSEAASIIRTQSFSEAAKVLSRDSIVYLGFSKGFITIRPDEDKEISTTPHYIAFTTFQIANKNVPIGQGSPLEQNIDYMKSITLNHEQNFINIGFATLDYIDPNKIKYAYMLEGFDKDWITSAQRVANYTNLAPGIYTFRVKSTNSDGLWLDNERTLEIEITPSFWQTNWALLLFVMIGLILFASILWVVIVFLRMKDRIKIEREQTEMKTHFFTDISHEIRTPLTMIVSPIEYLIDDGETPGNIKSQLNLVLRNVNRMLKMVNQILDFRKIQKKKLNVQETNIFNFVEEICLGFKETAKNKNISLKVSGSAANQILWIDRDSVEKLIFNLLSNALKYTNINKNIDVSVNNNGSVVDIRVKDEGPGMSKDMMNKLFVRFNSFNKDKGKPSTGIGLSIVKEVADKHSAKINVESEIGFGSMFSVSFNKGVEHFRGNKDVVFEEETLSVEEIYQQSDKEKEIEQDKEGKKRETILLVEDNAELKSFIKTMLTPYYEVMEASNGKDGYDIAAKELPDFIVSDIMMPEMDGMEMLQLIRKNNDISHIPIILLSAKTDIETKFIGLDYGADDYITKPFSVKYLRSRINNIMKQRKRLLKIYSQFSDTQNENEETKITSQDDLFIKQVEDLVRENIDNSDFLVEDLISLMGMSRTVFVKKIKSLTGLTPLEYVRNVKIRYAAILIDSNKYSIKEVSYMIGINDTKYFTQSFKRVFGMTPSEYKNRADKNNKTP